MQERKETRVRRRELKEGLRLLRRHVRDASRLPAPSPDAAWLLDHSASFGTALNAALRHPLQKRGNLPEAVWSRCKAFLAEGAMPTADEIGARFSDFDFSFSLCAALPVFLGAAAALTAAKGFSPSKQTEGAAAKAARFLSALPELETRRLPALLCGAERFLLRDPAGAYQNMDEETKSLYRQAVRRLARKSGCGEAAAASGALAGSEAAPKAQNHIGFYLPLSRPTPPPALLFGTEFAAAALCAAALTRFFLTSLRLAHPWEIPAGIVFFCLFAVFSAAVLRPLTDRGLRFLAQPRLLPRLDAENHEVALPRAVIAVTSLLPGAKEAPAFGAHLARIADSAGMKNTPVAALLDLPQAAQAELPTDDADLAAMKREIDRLNALRGGGFVLLCRTRVFLQTENAWAGRERKRGATEALARLLTDGEADFQTVYGDTKALAGAEFFLTLDADGELPFGAFRRLLAVAAHPCNRAVIENGRVVSGYGCFQPRMAVTPFSAGRTPFARIFTGCDVSFYARRVSERYMDLYGKGLFCGKGLIDTAAYRAACCGAFPDGQVLSHDMPEGALLRTAFVSDVLFTEGFPASPASYLRRSHRWIRGDVQNLRFALFPLKRETPEKRLPALARLQILDNLRRALTPVFAGLCALIALRLPQHLGAVLLGAALAAVSADAFFSLISAAFGFVRELCLNGSAAVSGRALLRAAGLLFFRTGLLPLTAAVNADAVARALWRSTVSHRKTLQWTTAAQSEKKRSGAGGAAILLIFAAVFAFGPLYAKLYAARVLSAVPFYLFGGKETKPRKTQLSAEDREALRGWAAASWRYFDRYVNADSHFLPPDNVQETPVFRIATRTSPTNMGFYLVCLLAAADLGLLEPQTMLSRLERSIETLETLPKYRGLLYNWYDIAALSPLPPAFVSSVDCGNYLCCITVLKAGLSEYAQRYAPAAALLPRVEKLIGEARLGTLYNPERELFSVGMETEAGRLLPVYYDAYMSEARLTSFFAVAKGIAPPSHWGALDRSRNPGGAPASYSGTAFEYFMPALFLPVYEHTLAGHGLAACLKANRRFARRQNAPWGVSESGYFAFDGHLNYQYKAHGLAALARRRDPAEEAVFAPYAAFLALGTDPAGAVRNLKRFEDRSAFGSCGFYEALDCTRRAAPAGERVVRSYMAHHVGMSLLAAANALTGDVFVRRFLRDPEMRAAESLLNEAPVSERAIPFRTKEIKRKVPSGRESAAQLAANRPYGVFSDGEATILTNERGENRFLYAGTQLLGFSRRAAGVVTAAAMGETVTPLLGAIPHRHGRSFTSGSIETAELLLRSAAALTPGESAALLPIQVKNTARTDRTVTLLWYFEPLFAPAFRPPVHEGFHDMRIRAYYEPEHAVLLFTRLENGAPGCWFGAGFHDPTPLRFTLDRETVLGSDPLRTHPFAAGIPSFTNDLRFTRPAAALGETLRLAPGERAEKLLILAPGSDRDAVLRRFARLRRQSLGAKRCAQDVFLRESFTSLAASAMIGAQFFGRDTKERAAAATRNTAPAKALWEQGVSGDLPVVRVFADPLPEAALRSVLRLHALLTAIGLPTDLVLLTNAKAVYGKPGEEAIESALAKEGVAATGGGGGVHIVHKALCSAGFLSALEAAPGVTVPLPGKQRVTSGKAVWPVGTLSRSAPLFSGGRHFVPNGYYIGEPAPRPWCHILANKSFGTLMTNASLGFTWAMNARLNPITPWSDDVCSHPGGERLSLTVNGKTYDCLAGAAVYFYDHAALYGAICGDTEMRVTVEVDAVAMKKRVTVRLRSENAAPKRVSYRITPVLAEKQADAAFVKSIPVPNGVRFRNPANTDYPGDALLCCDRAAVIETAGGAAVLSVPLTAKEDELRFTLAFSVQKDSLDTLISLPFREQNPIRFRADTGFPAADRFASSLLLHQAYTVRLLARTGFYQCSGAYGYRDQLQDAANAAAFYPAEARAHLLRAAAAQFREGDALHWFHTVPKPEPHLLGVRTRCADDFLWLPYCAAAYARDTGDESVFGVAVPFTEGAPLRTGETERCGVFHPGKEKDSFYGHCMRAVRRAANACGRHGLPLFGTGDWNDGMNETGKNGRGESVWLAMFLRRVCLDFMPFAKTQPDTAFLAETAETMRRAALRHGWEQDRFLRGYSDSGAPMGSDGSNACKIDLTVQAWAALSDVGTREQQRTALATAFRLLFREDPPLATLLWPPFTERTERAGYINDYPPGVRENGGQYTHAAVWFFLALTKTGMVAEAARVLEAILPPQEETALASYKNEPYALSGDVGAPPFFAGKAGWSQYTGAAGWLLRWAREQTEQRKKSKK